MNPIDGKYEVLRPLGSGVSGEVFRVRDPQGREMALKFLKEWQLGIEEREAQESFKREFSILKDLNHPNVARILDFGRDFGREPGGRYYFTTELVEGSDFFRATEGKKAEEVEALVVQALRALEYLHSRGIYHLDVKPANVLVTKDGRVKIIDFGLAGEKFGEKIAGTPNYMAPEVIYGDVPDGRADLYSLGVVFYYALSRENPFRAKSVAETLEKQKKAVPPPVSQARDGIPDYLDRILGRLLEKKRGDRYAAAAHVIRDINLLSGRNYPIETSETLLSYLPEEGTFIGRGEELASAQRFCVTTTRRTLWIRGDKGTGKSRFLKELKYFCQLQDLKVVLVVPGEHPPARPEFSVLLFDDIDRWSDADEERWFDFFQKAGGRPSLSFVAVMTSSAPLSFPLVQPFVASSGIETIELKNLSKEEVEKYVMSATGLPSPPAALVEALFERSDGNPLFMSEILKTLIFQHLLFDDQGRWRAGTLEDMGVDFSKIAVPETLKGLLKKIYLGESEEIRKSLNLAALLKRPVAMKDLEVLAGSRALLVSVTKLVQKGWFLRDRRKDEITLKNPLWVEVIQEVLSPEEKEKWHDRIAQWLERSGRPEEAALHWGEGSDPERGCRALMPVAKALVQKGRGAEAVPLFQKILVRLKGATHDDPKELIDLEMALGEAFLQSDSFAEAVKTFQKIGPLLSRVQNRDQDIFYKVDVHERLGMMALKLLRTEEAKADIQAGLTLLNDYEDDVARRMILENDLGQVWCQEGQLGKAEEIFRKTKTAWEKLPTAEQDRVTNNDLGLLHLLKGDAEEAARVLEEQLRFFERLPRRYPEARCHYNLAEAFSARQEHEKTVTHYELCLTLAKDLKAHDLLLRAYNGLGNVYSRIHKTNEAIDYYLRALAISQKLNDLSSQAAIHSNLGILYQENKQVTEAEHHLIGAIRIVGSLKDKSSYDLTYLARAHLELGSLLRGRKEFEKARDHLREAVRLADEHAPLKSLRFWVLHELARLYKDQGRTEELQDCLRDLRAEATTAEKKEKLFELEPSAPKKFPEEGWETIGKILKTLGGGQQETLENLRALAHQVGFVLVSEKEMKASEETQRSLQKSLKERLDHAQDELNLTRSLLQEESITFRTRYSYKNIVTRSKLMRDLFRILDKVTDTPLSVLIRGETGTGKELIARALHYNSPRKGKAFVAINCGAIPSELMESELFGHKAGAFTGATRDKVGLCEAADGGTLFLDEVGELSQSLQVKLLRFLQEKEFRRVGETETRKVDVRVLSATHQDLESRIREGRVREDLYFRLCEIVVAIPPLRERREDIPLLAESFMEEYRRENKISKKFRIDKALLRKMVDYAWPGNVRELENLIRVACALSEDGILSAAAIPAHSPLAGRQAASKTSFAPSSISIDGSNVYRPAWGWGDYEKLLVANAYRHHQFKAIPTAKAVGVTPPTLYRKVKEWKLEDPENPVYRETFQYAPGTTLKAFQSKLFRAALAHHKRPYATLRALGISQGYFYKVMKGLRA